MHFFRGENLSSCAFRLFVFNLIASFAVEINDETCTMSALSHTDCFLSGFLVLELIFPSSRENVR